MSQSNFKVYPAVLDGKQRKFPAGALVYVLWQGMTDYGESVRVISARDVGEAMIDPKKSLRSTFVKRDRIVSARPWGQTQEGVSCDLMSEENILPVLVRLGLIKDKASENQPVLFYGKVKQETDKALLIDLADLIEPEWFAKSTIIQRGKLTDRDQHGFEAPLWLLKKKVGEVKAKMFTDCRSAIERRLVT